MSATRQATAVESEPPDDFHFPLTFTWALPPLPAGPDLLQLALALSGIGGVDLPLEVSGIDAVFVNGQLVMEKGKHTGARPGKVLYGPGRKNL